jgi:hypothetical protein|tara:strand:- start:233 stop:499 length:267 start_codon:yes stop_codon:yes gene_type:complete
MTEKTVTVLESQKTVTVISDNGKTVEVTPVRVEVVTVGIQGPRGPSGSQELGGKLVTLTDTPVNGDLLVFNSQTDEWVFTTEVDAGTY